MKKLRKIIASLLSLTMAVQIGLSMPVLAEATEATRNPNLMLNIDGLSSRAVNWADNFGDDLTDEQVKTLTYDYVQNYLLDEDNGGNEIGRILYMTSWRRSDVDSDFF